MGLSGILNNVTVATVDIDGLACKQAKQRSRQREQVVAQ
jgi:hypothetical protein